MAARKREPSRYNLFVARMMPILCDLERKKDRGERKKPCELMKVIGTLWQLEKKPNIPIIQKNKLVYDKNLGIYVKASREDENDEFVDANEEFD